MAEPSTIRIHDTLSGELRVLEPREPGKVGIYVCGPTVYGRIHVGNARPYVAFMLYKRFLEHEGKNVTLVINITDINDKIYAAANAAGVPSAELAKEMAAAYISDTNRLGLRRPNFEPLASETIAGIIDLIQALIDGDHAYESAGDVYFAVRSHGDYGKLSNRRLDDMGAGEQGEPDDDTSLKRDPLDFALWKAHKEGEDTSWDSPWGRGRPGWHIECSAMSEQILGLDFDIHGGGLDLVFPHHENEIAQTEAGRDRPLARIWMHNGMIQFGEEKMAKSVGNIKLLHEALDEAGPEALIMYFLSGHYRRPLAFNPDSLSQSGQAVERIKDFLRWMGHQDDSFLEGPDTSEADQFTERFFEALRDDFNTPRALSVLFELISAGIEHFETGSPFHGLRDAVREMLEVFGLTGLESTEGPDLNAEILANQREEARRNKDFKEADRLRDELATLGYEVRDMPDGPPILFRIND